MPFKHCLRLHSPGLRGEMDAGTSMHAKGSRNRAGPPELALFGAPRKLVVLLRAG